ncbi:kinase-like domain-containing protein [Suillus subalutaceus]|uniref:kinase-like domain-containing protein n=1 Tax=Suillus subalutaceus TaxID=48586 RepID=UPI001B867F86|nr:kinase-like domain-containing protein [Suillus subalutaceus]KAG1831454.1 kinase-like domain-containing protein [Suillus subalutaceus]
MGNIPSVLRKRRKIVITSTNEAQSLRAEARPSTGDAASLGHAGDAVTTPQPVTPDTHELDEAPLFRLAFDVDPFAIPSTCIRRQFSHPISSGGMSDVWKCSMISNPATSTEVAVKSIRISDVVSDEINVQKAKKRLRREVAVWIKLSHAHILTLHGTVSGFGPLPALVSTWMDNGTLDGYLKCTSLTMEQKLKLLKQVVDGLRYFHEQGTNIVIDCDDNAFLADFGLSVVLAESDRSYYKSALNGAVRWSAPELFDSPEPESIPDDSDGDGDFPKSNSQSDTLFKFHLNLASYRSSWVDFPSEPYRVEPGVTVSHQHLDFMRKCWSAKPEAHPSTGDAASFVEYELASLFISLQKTADYVWDASGTNLDIRTTFIPHFTHIMAALELHSNPLIMTKSWQHSMRCPRA